MPTHRAVDESGRDVSTMYGCGATRRRFHGGVPSRACQRAAPGPTGARGRDRGTTRHAAVGALHGASAAVVNMTSQIEH